MISPDAADRAGSADDLALVQRIADRDPLALAALYDRHAETIYSHGLHLLGDVAEAEDSVEETFWRVWQRAREYDPALLDVRSWLIAICRQRATDRIRARKRAPEDALGDTTGPLSTEEAEPLRGDRAKIAAALGAIPEDQRTVLELAFFRGMAPADVASVTTQSPETARTRLRVAMRKLRDALGEVSADGVAAEGSGAE